MDTSKLLFLKSGRSTVYYDPNSGIFYRQYIGAALKRANKPNGTYLYVSVENVRYAAHRLAWFMFYGVWPSQVIDHINGKPTDNRITNLRDVSQRVNANNYKGSIWEIDYLTQALVERRKQRNI